jgi:hypothetical protein
MDAAVQAGNSGGPIYDEYGNIVGVVVAPYLVTKSAVTLKVQRNATARVHQYD